jgi:ABC-type multidrug transport system fused ATPase/permease subunit
LAGVWVVKNIHATLFVLFGIILIISILQMICGKLMQYCQLMHDNIINNEISLMLMDRALTIDLEYFDNPNYYDKLLSVTRDSTSFATVLWNALSLISACISFLSAFCLLSRESLLYGIVLALISIPSAIASAKYTKLLYNLSLDQIKAEREKNYYKSLSLDKRYAQDIRLFNLKEYLRGKYTLLWNELFNKQRNMTRKRTLLTSVLDCLPELSIIIIGLHVAFKIVDGTLTIGDYTLYTGLTGQLLTAVLTLSLSITQLYDNKLRITNLRTLDQFRNHIIDNGILNLSRIDTIEFNHVSFSYPGSQSLALDDVNFTLYRNEKVAFVGLNGSGKSTVIKLLLRMYDLDIGSIRINGIDIREYRISDLRSNFSVYFQEMQNYSFSLRENVRIGDINNTCDDKVILNAFRNSYCEDIIDKVPNGLDTSLTKLFNENGIELSLGQHQKIALARALYRRHTAIVLDEPSSGLDPKAEYNIFKSLSFLTDEKMTIFTSHRLSNVSLADRIIVLEYGKIIEDGTQEQLIKNQNRYAELFHYQNKNKENNN